MFRSKLTHPLLILCIITTLLALSSCFKTHAFSPLAERHPSTGKVLFETEGVQISRRVPVRGGWLDRIPSRSFDNWLDEANSIYRTNRGSIIGPYRQLADSISKGQRPSWLPEELRNSTDSLEAHHLIERRVARAFGLDPDQMPAVILARDEHRGGNSVHSILRSLLPQGDRRTGSLDYRDRLAQINQAYQRAYADHDDWLDAITATIHDWSARN
jgi:hypothetical protein